jgi:hypothetical protein
MLASDSGKNLMKPSFPGVGFRMSFETIHHCPIMICCTVALVLGAVIPCRADDPVPKPFASNRYQSVRDHSPFAVATAEAPPPAPQASFAANLFVSGLGRWGDDDFVTIKSRDAGTQFSLFGHETDPSTGISVASVNWTDVVGKSTVILKKGTETAKLEFNEMDVHGAPAANPQNRPGAPVSNGNGPRPMQSPANMTGLPAVPAIPTNPVMNNGRPMPNGAPGVHRRTQVIQPPQ